MKARHRVALLLGAVVACQQVLAAAPAVPGKEQPTLATQLAEEEAALRPQRRSFQTYFKQAYARYPSIPAGTLEAIAYVQSRWMNLQPQSELQIENHQQMPRAYGVMGLYAGQGFADQVGDAARLLRLPTESVKNNARLNILAAAALLDDRIKREIGSPGRDARGRIHPVRPEEISTVLMHYAGFSPSPVTSQVTDYARASSPLP